MESVTVIFPGALGDLLLALPALRFLRARHAGARVALVVSEPLRGLAALADVADITPSLDGREAVGLFAGDRWPSWIEPGAVVYSWLGSEDESVRPRILAASRHARFFRIERGPGTVHAAAAYAVSVGATASRSRLAAAARVVPANSVAADTFCEGLGAPVLAIHPGAGARAKRWDVAGFVQVAQWWRSGGGTVVAVAGPAEASEAPVLGGAEIRDWPLPDLAALLARSALYLGNDSGVSHLAGAVGTAGVVLFGPTAARRWRPVSGRLVALQGRPSGPDGISLSALPAARVIAACRRRFALTRGNLDISVSAESRASRVKGLFK